jgi:hypothetical protein
MPPLRVRTGGAGCTLRNVTVFLPLVLVGPLLMLATAVAALSAHGPLGWLAAVALVVAVLWATRVSCRLCLRWWRGTKAPVRDQ